VLVDEQIFLCKSLAQGLLGLALNEELYKGPKWVVVELLLAILHDRKEQIA
jgi:hypothetical protein